MKEEVAEGLKEESTLTLISVSDPAEKKEYKSIRIRPVTIKGKEMFQAECFTQKQAFHKNIAANGLRGGLRKTATDINNTYLCTKIKQ